MGYSVTLPMFNSKVVLLEFAQLSGSPLGWYVYSSDSFKHHGVSYNLKRFYAKKLFELFDTPYYCQAFLFSDRVFLFMLVLDSASTGDYSFSSVFTFLM